MGFRDCLPCFGGAKEGNTADGASEEAQTPNHPTTAPAKPSVSPPPSRIENEAQPTAHQSDGYPFTAHGVWRSAYEELRGDDSTHALVIAYEDLLRSKLSQMLPPEDTLDASDLVSKFAGFDSTLRSDFMDKVANQHIEKLEASVGKACLPKVLEFVDKIKATVGQALSSCPAASIAWTVTCLLIVPVTQYNSENQENQSGLAYVVSRLPWYNEQIELLKSDNWSDANKFGKMREYIRQQIQKLYKLLIEYQLRSFGIGTYAIAHVVKQSINWNDWKGRMETIKGLEKQLRRDTETCNTAELQNKFKNLLVHSQQTNIILSEYLERQLVVLERIADATDDADIQRMINEYRLSPEELDGTIYYRYANNIAKLDSETGRGVLDHAIFTNWMESQNGLLVLAAGPGTGKSVLAKHVQDTLFEEKQIVCSFFFKDQTKNQTSPRIALCKMMYDLLQQLQRSNPNLIKMASSDLKFLCKEKIQLNSDEFWKVLGLASSLPGVPSVTFIFDALDEADPDTRDNLSRHLSEFSAKFPSARLRIMCTTRPSSNIWKDSSEHFILEVEKDEACLRSLEEDIGKVTQQKLEDFQRDFEFMSEDQNATLSSRLKKYNEQNYIFAQLCLKYLERKLRKSFEVDWEEIFASMPENVEGSYTKLLETVDPHDHKMIQLIIQIMLAAARPLTVDEINIAVGLHTKSLEKCTRPQQARLRDSETFGNLLWTSCNFLFQPIGNYVHFVHQTVKDYLLSSAEQHTWLDRIDLESCHREMGKICMNYLSWNVVQNDSRFMTVDQYLSVGVVSQSGHHQLCRDYLFGDYGMRYWLHHFRESFKNAQSLTMMQDLIKTSQPGWSLDFAIALFCCSGLPDDADIKLFLKMLPMEYPAREDLKVALCSSLIETYWSAGGLSNLVFAIQLAEEIVDTTAEDYPKKARILAVLAEGHTRRFEARGDPEDLTQAVRLASAAFEKAPGGHPDHFFVLVRYVNVLYVQSMDTWDINDINRAILISEEATASLTGIALPDLGQCLVSRSQILKLRGINEHQVKDLDESIQLAELALEMLNGHGDHQAVTHNHLGFCFGERFSLCGDFKDREASNAAYKTAVDMISPESPYPPLVYENLAQALERSYDETSDEVYLNESIEANGIAIKLAPEDLPAKAIFLRHHHILKDRLEKVNQQRLVPRCRDKFSGFIP